MLSLLKSSYLPYLLSLFVLLAFLYKSFLVPRKLDGNKPPSPRKLPVIGNLHQLGLRPHRSLEALARKHGSLMLLHFGSKAVLIASSADVAREILKIHDLFFSSRPQASIPARLTYNAKDIGFAPYGEHWRKAKSIAVLQLLSNKRVQSFQQVREEETAFLIDEIRNMTTSPSSVVNLSDLVATLTNNVVCRVAFGRKYSGRKFKKLLHEFGDLLGVFRAGDYIPWLSWVDAVNGLNARVEKNAKELDEFLEGVVEEHLNRKGREQVSGVAGDDQGERQDFVDIFLDIQSENTMGVSVDRDTIKAVILDMFAAGTDTVSTVIEWTMAELLRHPKVLEKLQSEVKDMVQSTSKIKENDLEKLHYLKAIIKESLRLHPPVPLLVPRESTEEVKLMGYNIPAGTRAFINVWAIGRDPTLWEDPEKFKPERFMNSSIDYKGLDFELIPFGSGRRGCPGIKFGVSIIELVLANLVYNFDFGLPGGERGKDLDMSEAGGLSVHMKLPLMVLAKPHFC